MTKHDLKSLATLNSQLLSALKGVLIDAMELYRDSLPPQDVTAGIEPLSFTKARYAIIAAGHKPCSE